ncbi:NAD-dependent epimerase/dehydratase family protein [Agromyces mediolanus]|uniref:NAD-dependent epimerase/dehydratase family protein n=1 Tax=Agromyces mediolanus TaxID=41986 RepID=UPI003837CF26
MRILLTGATGTIGSAVLAELVAAGHEVAAIVRSEQSAERVAAAGANARLGEVTDHDWFTARLSEADAAIHTAAPQTGAAEFDSVIVDAIELAFAGTERRFVHTSGIWEFGSGVELDDDGPLDPPEIVAWRVPLEERLLAGSVSATIIAPGVVYGDGGIPDLVTTPEADGRVRLVGDGRQHWSLVHRTDLARLYRLAVEHPHPSGRVIAVDGEPLSVRAIGEAAVAAGRARGVAEESADDSRARLGTPFADALLLDQRALGRKARSLGWLPAHRSLLETIA